MTARVESVTWTDDRRIPDLLAYCQAHSVDCLSISPDSRSVSRGEIDRTWNLNSSSNLIVFCDSGSAVGEMWLRSALPPMLKLIAALPDLSGSVAVSVNSLASQPDVVAASATLCELVVRLAERGTVTFVEQSQSKSDPSLLPELMSPSQGPRAKWLREIIHGIIVPSANSTAMAAFKAGLFLLNDFADESHSCSQSIEGLGRDHSGDYWHAILHRREPDYGNSKYWFRHVGRHSVFAELPSLIGGLVSASPGKMDKLLRQGEWDPFAFVDLCAEAERVPQLAESCRIIQFQEMSRLLEWTYGEAVGSNA